MKPRAVIPITIGSYTIDASIRETHTFESEVTTFPVEQGSPIADNIRLLPIAVEIEYLVSDTPLPPIEVLRETDEESVSPPSVGALAALLAIRDAREPVPIATAVQRYENMALKNLVVPRDATTGEALGFTASFMQITIVQTQRTTVATRTARPQDQAKIHVSTIPGTTQLNGIYVTSRLKAGLTEGEFQSVVQQFGNPIYEDDTRYAWRDETDADGYIGSDQKYHPITFDGTLTEAQFQQQVAASSLGNVSLDPSTNTWVNEQGLPVASAPPSNADQFSFPSVLP